MLEELEYKNLICNFASKKARRIDFCGARPKNNGLVQIQARPRSVLFRREITDKALLSQ